jgi:hypothetical protein
MLSFLVSTHLEIFAAIHLVSKSNLDLAPNRRRDSIISIGKKNISHFLCNRDLGSLSLFIYR